MATEYLVLLHDLRTCAKCGASTYWALESRLWSDKGICLTHAGAIYERGDPPSPTSALRAIIRAMGTVDVNPPTPEIHVERPVERAVRWICSGLVTSFLAYLGDSTLGRCAGCGATIRRYGPGGRPLCDPCATPHENGG